MYKKSKKRPCKVCKADLNMWGEDRKGTCPDCAKAVKDTPVRCAGRCKNVQPIRLMEVVSFYFEPGVKGGKKFSVYYCPQCLLSAKSRARMICDSQQEAIKKSESRRAREQEKLKRGGKK